MNAGHDILRPPGMTPSTGPTLLTGVKISDADHLVDDLMEWERKFEAANLDNHMQFLRNAQLTVGSHHGSRSLGEWLRLRGTRLAFRPARILNSGIITTISLYGVKTTTTNCCW